MKRGIVPLAVIAVVSGCAADSGDGGILVLKNVHPDTMCTTTSLETETSVSRGVLDIALRSDYLFIAQMKSRITALTGQEDQRTIITTGAKIDIAFPGSMLFSAAELADLKTSGLTHFKSLFSAPIAPNGGIRDGDFVLIPSALVDRIAAKADLTKAFRVDAVATFTVEGDMSGETVASQPFTFPVTIGNGVTVDNQGPCPLPKTFGVPRPGYICNPAQDGVVDCCTTTTTLGTTLTCPATVSAM
jgi:hypothetical protein